MNNIENQTGPMFFFKKTRNVKTLKANFAGQNIVFIAVER